MASNFTRERPTSKLGRDFASLKKLLTRFSEAHHSGVFVDLNEASPGMAFLETIAYVGDTLSFYQDQMFNETKQDTAREIENVVSFAKMKGYKPRGPAAARGKLSVAIEVPATTNARGEVIPNDAVTPYLLKGARTDGPEGSGFETLENVYFSSSLGRDITGSRFDNNTGQPTHFALRKYVEIIAGETKSEAFVISNYEKFKKLELSEDDVIEIIDVIDSDGNQWYEVEYLAQDWVFDSEENGNADSEEVPYVLKLLPVPRRFIVDRNPSTGKSSLIFGAGDGINFDDELIPNLADYALPLAGRRTYSSFAVDPRNFLKTRSLGLSPYGTTLTVRYRVGGGIQTNAAQKTIRNFVDATLVFPSNAVATSVKGDIEGSLACLNIEKTSGGGPAETITEIKLNSNAYFAAQSRIVTCEDYIARTLSLPAKFGKPDKVYVKRNAQNLLSMDLHVLSRDSNNHLTTASAGLKNNIKTFLKKYRMQTEGVNILDSDIINLRCNFGVVVNSRFNRSEVLVKCISAIRDELDVDLMQIGQPIVLSNISSILQSIQGVISVYELMFSNVFGTTDGLSYSETRFDTRAAVRNNILYCPDNSIFELKYPERDIIGVTK